MTEQDYLDIRKRPEKDGEKRFTFKRTRGGTTVDFLPGTGAKLHFGNRDADTCSFGDVPAGFFVSGDRVTVFYGGTIVFVGELQKRTEVRGRGDLQREDVTFAGPWEAMRRLVYRQYWNTGDGYSLSSRLILNQHQSGTPQNLDSELREILAHGAEACGYGIGTVSVSSKFLPFDECRDITVADAVNRELRFFPKSVVRFDYSGETPTVSILRGADNATDASYVATVAKTDRTYEYDAHPITGVDLEIETTVDGYRQIVHQTAGQTTAGNPDCLYATIQLQGASGSTVTQSLEVETEEIDDITAYDWWLKKHPRLANYAPGEVRIRDAKRSGEADKDDYPRIAKNAAGELKSAGIKCRVETFSCTATVSCGQDIEEDIMLTMQFLTTNATTKTYRWVVSSESEAGETCPEGLAAAILADRSGTLMNERMAIRLGDALPVIGDRCDGLYLQSFDIDCASLTAELNFGQPEHLSVEDMASLLSGFRNKKRPSTVFSRYTAKPQDDHKDEVEIGGIPPLQSTDWSPGQKVKTEIASKDPGSNHITLDSTKNDGGDGNTSATSEAKGGNIELKTAQIDAGKTIAVRKMTIKGAGENGADLIVQVLATEDLTVSPGAGATNGVSGKFTRVTKSEYDTSSHKFVNKRQEETFTNGILTEVKDLSDEEVFESVEHLDHNSSGEVL